MPNVVQSVHTITHIPVSQNDSLNCHTKSLLLCAQLLSEAVPLMYCHNNPLFAPIINWPNYKRCNLHRTTRKAQFPLHARPASLPNHRKREIIRFKLWSDIHALFALLPNHMQRNTTDIKNSRTNTQTHRNSTHTYTCGKMDRQTVYCNRDPNNSTSGLQRQMDISIFTEGKVCGSSKQDLFAGKDSN